MDEILRTGYTRYVATDMNGDAREELLLIQLDSSSQTPGQVELYVGSDGIMEFHSAASLSQGILSLQLWEARDLLGEAKGLMVTSEWGDNRHITDIFCLSETGLRNVTLNESTRISESTLRHYTGVSPTDINGDGITEIPISKSIPTYNSGTGAENFWQIDWKQVDQSGKSYSVLSTYHNNSDRWYLELPSQWNNVITLKIGRAHV